jgi:hypothetical protein
MHIHRTSRSRAVRLGALLGAAGLATALSGGSAWASGSGSPTKTTTDTEHVHGAAAYDMSVIDFNPLDSPPEVSLPADCWLPDTYALMSTNGNGVFHTTTNKAQDFWLTTTYTGDAVALPLVFNPDGSIAVDNNQNDVVDQTATPLASGHLTVWFGAADNKQDGVQHATVGFNGTEADGTPVNLHGHFQFVMDSLGNPKLINGSVSC